MKVIIRIQKISTRYRIKDVWDEKSNQSLMEWVEMKYLEKTSKRKLMYHIQQKKPDVFGLILNKIHQLLFTKLSLTI